MVGRFAIQYFCGGFQDGKMTAWLNEETEDLFYFLGGSLDVFRGMHH